MEKIIRVGENSRRFVRMHDDNYGRIILSNEKKANRSDARSRSGERLKIIWTIGRRTTYLLWKSSDAS